MLLLPDTSSPRRHVACTSSLLLRLAGEYTLPSAEPILLLLRRLENLERAQQGLVDTHHRTRVVEFAAVVRGGEQSDELALAKELVSVLDDLVGAAYQIHVVLLEEARHDVGPECEGDAAIVLAPACDVLVRIRPQQVAEQTAIRNLCQCQYGAYQVIVSWNVRLSDASHGGSAPSS